MSSDFYASKLSRNLVSIGAFGYRENVALCLSIKATEDATQVQNRAPRRIMSFLVFPSFDLDGGTMPRKSHSEASHLGLMITSLENYSPAGPVSL